VLRDISVTLFQLSDSKLRLSPLFPVILFKVIAGSMT